MKNTLVLLFSLLLSGALVGQTNVSQTFGEYTVYYSVFNSTFLDPDIAALHGFTRGRDRALINIALIKKSPEGDSLGLQARVSGTAQNLIMQYRPLNFIEVREGDAVYYLAPFSFNNEEPLHFTINVAHDGVPVPYEVKFTKTLYRD